MAPLDRSLVSYTVNSTISRTAANTVTPGRNKAAEINAKLARLAAAATLQHPRVLYIPAGEYYLENRIVRSARANYMRVECDPAAVFISEVSGGGVDDASNSIVKLDGALDLDTCDTVLSADAAAGDTAITVVDPGELAAGDWVLISGNNGGGQNYPGDYGNSDGAPGIVLKDLVQVDSVVGTTINLKWPLTVNHAGPVKASVQAIDAVVGWEWYGGTFLGSEGGVATANAILARYAKDVVVSDFRAEGFTRYPLEVVAALAFRSHGFKSLGNNNAWVKLEAVTGKVTGFSGLDGVARSHTLGYPRDLITTIDRCADLEIADGHIHGGAIGGLFCAGGLAPSVRNLHIRNMRLTAAEHTRWCAAPEINASPSTKYHHALGLGWGNGDLSYAEFSTGAQIANVTIDASTFEIPSTWQAENPPRAWAAYLHDSLRCQIANLMVINHGGYKTGLGGVRWSDIEGDAVNVTVKGFGFQNMSQNVLVDVRFHNLRTDPVCADGVAPGTAWYLDHDSIAGNGPTFYGWKHNSDFASGQSLIYMGSAWLASEPSYPDNRFTVHDLERDDGRWEYVHFAMQTASFAMYDVVEIDPTYTGTGLMRVRTPVTTDAGYEKRLVTIVGVHNNNVVTIATLPQARAVVKCTSAEVKRGDNLVYDAATPKRLKADNTAAGLAASVGVAYSYKAAGAEGVVRVGD